jgi:hypothetical protein
LHPCTVAIGLTVRGVRVAVFFATVFADAFFATVFWIAVFFDFLIVFCAISLPFLYIL